MTDSYNHYCFVISASFRAVVSTNDSPLSLPRKDALELVDRYNDLYPGADFYAEVTDSDFAQYCIKNYQHIYIAVDGLDWSVLSKLEWLERLANSRKLIGWLSAVCRQC